MPEIWVCSICRIGVNNIVTKTGGLVVQDRWIHSRGKHDHEADPVLLAEIPGSEMLTICDLCSAPDPQNLWRSSSSGYFSGIKTGINLSVLDRDNAWLVCDQCEPYVASGDLKGLLVRVYAALQERNPHMKFDTTTRGLIADRVGAFVNNRVGSSERRNF